MTVEQTLSFEGEAILRVLAGDLSATFNLDGMHLHRYVLNQADKVEKICEQFILLYKTVKKYRSFLQSIPSQCTFLADKLQGHSQMHAVFWELASFARHRERYLNDDEYRVVQIEMMSNPTTGTVGKDRAMDLTPEQLQILRQRLKNELRQQGVAS